MPFKFQAQNFCNGDDGHISYPVVHDGLGKKSGVIGVSRLSNLTVDFDVVRLADKSRFTVGGLNFFGNVVFTLERQYAERFNPFRHVGNRDILPAVAVGVNVIDNIIIGSLFDDDAIISYLNGRADFHGVKKFLNVAFVHANTAVGDVAADTFGAIGAVNAVIIPNLHPTIAQRIIGAGRDFVFGV